MSKQLHLKSPRSTQVILSKGVYFMRLAKRNFLGSSFLPVKTSAGSRRIGSYFYKREKHVP
jgi:hypothetical protein